MFWPLMKLLYEYFKDYTPAAVQMIKIGEEYGEACEAFVNMTGGNPRKDASEWCPANVCDELVDVMVSCAVALYHFTDDPEEMFNDAMTKYETRLKEMQGE